MILAELWSCGQGAARSPHDGVEALDVRVQGTPTRPERWRSATSATPVTLSPGNGLPPEPGVNLRRDQPPISFTKPVPEPIIWRSFLELYDTFFERLCVAAVALVSVIASQGYYRCLCGTAMVPNSVGTDSLGLCR